MNSSDLVGVCSRSFSKNPVLRAELLSRYKYVKFNDEGHSLNGDSLVSFLDGCSKAITALESITYEVLSQLPKLEVVSKYGVGLDMIDIKAMIQLGKKLGWTAGVNKRSVSEIVLSFALGHFRNVFNSIYEKINI
jgi:D-3-phosphoglycerate dehydrogenase